VWRSGRGLGRRWWWCGGGVECYRFREAFMNVVVKIATKWEEEEEEELLARADG